MKTEVWLIRHGETEWNRLGKIQGLEDIELNDEGLRQARKAGEALRETCFAVILSSPLKRALRTAECIQSLNICQPPLVTTGDLMERDYGHFSGLSYAEKERLKTQGEDTGESEQKLHDRAANVLKHIAETYEGKPLAVVSHGGFIKTLLAAASSGMLDRKEIRGVSNCSISKLVCENGQWTVLEHNRIEHLNHL